MANSHYQRKVRKVRHKHPKAFSQVQVFDFGEEMQTQEISSRDVDVSIRSMKKNPDKIIMVRLNGSKMQGELAWYKGLKDPSLFPQNMKLERHDLMNIFNFTLAWYLEQRDENGTKEMSRIVSFPKQVRKDVNGFIRKIRSTRAERQDPGPAKQ